MIAGRRARSKRPAARLTSVLMERERLGLLRPDCPEHLEATKHRPHPPAGRSDRTPECSKRDVPPLEERGFVAVCKIAYDEIFVIRIPGRHAAEPFMNECIVVLELRIQLLTVATQALRQILQEPFPVD